MATLSELSFRTRLFLKTYPWRRIDPVPFAPLRRPLSAANVAIVSTAGLVMPAQERFDDAMKGGDPSWREIPDEFDVAMLVDSHRSESFDHSGVQSDPALAFPIPALHELAERGVIGRVNRRHFSMMGSITAPGRLTRDGAPAVADALVADGVDAVLLVPI